MLASKENKINSTNTVVSSFTYSVNPLSQRTSVQTSGTAFQSQPANWNWGYDALGQVISADSPTSSFDRAYQYDAIGNRTSSTDNTALTTYAANALNQYSQISPPSPSSPVVPLHDYDGNQIDAQIRPLGSSSLVSCVFHWDAENRLIAVKDKATNAMIVTYTYDAGSRRVARTEGSNTTVYLYDRWNCVADYTLQTSSFILQTSHTWGVDLSGLMQGAGGVGGLLATRNEQLATSYFPAFDGNGNVSEYLSGTGAIAAHFEYDPFGRTVVASLLETANLTLESFSYRFSTKPVDASTGLYYYGYRWFDSDAGRWINRDPIEEGGKVNVNGFIGNDGVNNADFFGLIPVAQIAYPPGLDYPENEVGDDGEIPSCWICICRGKNDYEIRQAFLNNQRGALEYWRNEWDRFNEIELWKDDPPDKEQWAKKKADSSRETLKETAQVAMKANHGVRSVGESATKSAALYKARVGVITGLRKDYRQYDSGMDESPLKWLQLTWAKDGGCNCAQSGNPLIEPEYNGGNPPDQPNPNDGGTPPLPDPPIGDVF